MYFKYVCLYTMFSVEKLLLCKCNKYKSRGLIQQSGPALNKACFSASYVETKFKKNNRYINQLATQSLSSICQLLLLVLKARKRNTYWYFPVNVAIAELRVVKMFRLNKTFFGAVSHSLPLIRRYFILRDRTWKHKDLVLAQI